MVGLLAPARGRGMKTAAAIAPESRDSGAQAAATAVGKMPALKCLLAPGHDSCWVGAGKALDILAMGEWLCAQVLTGGAVSALVNMLSPSSTCTPPVTAPVLHSSTAMCALYNFLHFEIMCHSHGVSRAFRMN